MCALLQCGSHALHWPRGAVLPFRNSDERRLAVPLRVNLCRRTCGSCALCTWLRVCRCRGINGVMYRRGGYVLPRLERNQRDAVSRGLLLPNPVRCGHPGAGWVLQLRGSNGADAVHGASTPFTVAQYCPRPHALQSEEDRTA